MAVLPISSMYGGRVIGAAWAGVFVAEPIAFFFLSFLFPFSYDPKFGGTIHAFSVTLVSCSTLQPCLVATSCKTPLTRVRCARSWSPPGSDVGSRSSLCALALLKLAHEESLIGGTKPFGFVHLLSGSLGGDSRGTP